MSAYITPEDLAMLSQRTVNGIIKHSTQAEDMDIDEVRKRNNELCKIRMRNYIHDNPQMFVEHFRKANASV